MNSNIFQIEQKYLDIINTLELNEGELTEQLAEELDITLEERDAKMEAYVAVIKQKQADIGLAKDEIKRYQALVKTNQNTIDRLKNVLISALEVFDLRNKAGNLNHRLPNGTLLYVKELDAVEFNDNIKLDYDTLSAYPDVCEVTISSKMTKSQLDKIAAILSEEDSDYLVPDFKVTTSATKFKESLIGVASIEDEETKENEYARFEHLGQIVTNKSLNIR